MGASRVLFCLAAALVLLAGPQPARALTPAEREIITVLATVRDAPPQISLDWPSLSDSGGFTVYRKPMEAGSWGASVATLPGDAVRFDDDDVAVGVGYEYRIQTVNNPPSAGGRFPATGHVYSGIRLPPADARGAVLLLVDATMAAPLAGEIARLEQDLIGDGWTVLRRAVTRQATISAPGTRAEVEAVKAVIREAFNAEPDTLRAVFILGRVPIPYSGWLSPDGHGHTPRPADTYYALPDVTWTDTQDYGARNTAGDGVYDQSLFDASSVTLAVGRVDLSGMPFFGLPETELLRRYLNKLHAYRHRRTAYQPVGGVAAGGLVGCRTAFTLKTLFHRNATRVDGLDGQWNGEFLAPSLWRYQEGLAFNSHALGEKLSARAPEYVFTGCWGSGTINYDEGADDGRLAVGRAYLANGGAGLTWFCGVPDRHLHWMSMGETIGTCERLAMANGALYPSGANGNTYDRIFRGLLGDPTLRLSILAPPTGLTLAGGVLSWDASPEAGTAGFQGYHVYRAPAPGGRFVRLTDEPVPGTTWTDPAPPAEAVYQVRAIRLETSPTGSYHNNSQGLFATRNAVAIVPEYLWASVPEGVPTPLRVRLSSLPASAVTVAVARVAGDTRIAVASGARLMFSPADWSAWQTVTLDAARGDDAGDASALIALTAPGLTAAHVGVVRPASTIRVSSQSLSVPGTGAAYFLVRLSSPPPAGQPVLVTTTPVSKPQSQPGGAITILAGKTLAFADNDWDVWRPVTLACVGTGATGAPPPRVEFALSAPGYRGISVNADVWRDAGETNVTLTAYAGFGGASVSPLGITPVTRGTSVPLTATAAPGFRFVRWVATRGPVTFADPSSARTPVSIDAPARILAVFERGERIPPAAVPDGNRAPEIVAAAQADAPVAPLAGTKVRGAARDPDGDPIAYRWSLAFGAGPVTFAAPDAAESAVTFSAVGTHVLRMTVSDGKGGAVASEVTVTAVTPPAFVRQPSDAAAFAGQAVKFGTHATGAFLSYRWFRNGKLLEGKTDRDCLMPPAAAADNGARFTVEVSNPAGVVLSREAPLMIVDNPPGTGLDGEYFNDATFTRLAALRTDPVLRGDMRPKGVSAPYSVRWTGTFLAPYSETFTFSVHNGRSGGKMWVDGRLLDDGGTFKTGGSITLVAGKLYAIKLELICHTDAPVYFQWNSETLDFPMGPEGYPGVPGRHLYSVGGGKQQPPPVAADPDRLPEL